MFNCLVCNEKLSSRSGLSRHYGMKKECKVLLPAIMRAARARQPLTPGPRTNHCIPLVHPPTPFSARIPALQDFDPDNNADDDAEMSSATSEDSEAALAEIYEQAGKILRKGTTPFERLWNKRKESQEAAWAPWSSLKEWEFARWLMRSGASHSQIDKLLKLDIVSFIRFFEWCVTSDFL